MEQRTGKPHGPDLQHSVPAFWPMAAVVAMEQAELALFRKNLKFVQEAEKIDHGLKPRFATHNTVLLDLHTLQLRAFGAADATAVPTLVVAPYAGHSAAIADYHKGQSLVQTLRGAAAGAREGRSVKSAGRGTAPARSANRIPVHRIQERP